MDYGVTYDDFKRGAFLGEGGYGAVYEGVLTKTGLQIAMKFEVADTDMPYLTREANAYHDFEHISGIPKMYWYGVVSKYRVLIIDRLQCTLEEKCSLSSHFFPLETIVDIALQSLSILKKVHDAGYVHRDVKPDNFMMDADNKVYLIDFGLTIPHHEPLGPGKEGTKAGHIKMKGNKKPRKSIFAGTPRYASVACHEGCKGGRRDDVESWCYMVAFLMRGSLPWQGLGGGKRNLRERIHAKKKAVQPDMLFYGFPIEFSEILTSIYNLEEGDAPDYRRIETLLRNSLKIFT